MTIAVQPQLHLPLWASTDRWERYQEPVYNEILDRFNDGNDLVVLSAPTGSGKSLLGQMVLQSFSDPFGMYLVTTLTLQDQITRDFPTTTSIKGRRNYVPPIPADDATHEVTCADCDLDPVSKLCSFCYEPNTCPYKVARGQAEISETCCTNYSYFLGVTQNETSPFRNRELVIADECHTIESEIMRFVSVSISPRLQNWLGLKAPKYKTKEDAWIEWFDYAIPHITKRLQTITLNSLPNKRRKDTLTTLVSQMRRVANDPSGYIYTGYDQGRIEFKPVTVDKIAPESFWNRGKKFLCMSATVVPDLLVQSLGYEGAWAPVFAPSTFPKENRPVYFCPSAKMTKKLEDVERPKMGQALKAVLNRHPNERILVHTHSFGLTTYLLGALEDVERPVFSYTSGLTREQAIADYDAHPDAVLLAASLEQGFDGADDRVGVVVVCKVPFASLGDKQVSTRLYSTKGGQFWYAANTAQMLIQALGRGVRHEEDTATHYILDSTFSSFYAKWNWLFADWLKESIHLNSDTRFELRQAVRELAI